MTAAPILLTPGPLTTSMTTKQSMLRDWGSWDADFNSITARIRERLLAIVAGAATHECVPLQGSGTFAVEAAIGTLVPRSGHVLVPQNGAYCQRITRICRVLGRPVTIDRLLGLVKAGMTQSATTAVPLASTDFIHGMCPCATACAM